MTKKRFLLALALMLTAVGGAWAQGNTTPVNPTTTPNQWQLTVPAGNVQLSVEYYGQYTLDSIPLDWQVKVGAAAPVSPTAYTTGNTALGHVDNINETDSVELIPPADVKATIKAVTLVKALQSKTVSWMSYSYTIYFDQGESWADAIQNHPTENAGWSVDNNNVQHDGNWIVTDTASSYISASNPINPNETYLLEALAD